MTIEVFYESKGIIYASSDSVGGGKNKFYYHKYSNSIIAHGGLSLIGDDVLNYIKNKEINNIADLVNEIEKYLNNNIITHDISLSNSVWIIGGYVNNSPVYYNIIYHRYNTQIKNGKLNNTLIYNGTDELLEYKYLKKNLETGLSSINLDSKDHHYNNDILNELNKYVKNCIDKNLVAYNVLSSQLNTDYPIQYMVINNTGLIKEGEIEGEYEYDSIPYLFKAIENKNIPNIMKYIHSNKDINKYDILPRVIFAGNIDILKIFLNHGLDINIKNANGETYLLYLMHQYRYDHIKYFTDKIIISIIFLIENGADVNAKYRDGKTPLHIASYYGSTKTVKYFISHGADVNVKDIWEYTPLTYASQKGNTETVKFLIEHGADVNVERSDGNTPLYFASEKGHTEIVEMLIENGADVNAKNKNGYTPLDIAKEKGHTEIFKILVNKILMNKSM